MILVLCSFMHVFVQSVMTISHRVFKLLCGQEIMTNGRTDGRTDGLRQMAGQGDYDRVSTDFVLRGPI